MIMIILLIKNNDITKVKCTTIVKKCTTQYSAKNDSTFFSTSPHTAGLYPFHFVPNVASAYIWTASAYILGDRIKLRAKKKVHIDAL
jgi:hypothetical protein